LFNMTLSIMHHPMMRVAARCRTNAPITTTAIQSKRLAIYRSRKFSSSSSSAPRQQRPSSSSSSSSPYDKYKYASPSHVLHKNFGVPPEISDKLSMMLAGAMGATAALGMVAAIVTSTTRLDTCYGSNNISPADTAMVQNRQQHSTPSTKCEGDPQRQHDKGASKLFRKKTTLLVANDAAAAAATATAAASAAVQDQDESQNADKNSSDRQQRHVTVINRLQRLSTRDEINKIRKHQTEILKRWERDEEGFRKLPARAWPPYQPGPEDLKGIVAEIKLLGCHTSDDFPLKKRNSGEKKTSNDVRKNNNIAIQVEEEQDEKELCTQLLFDMATALVFYNLDPQRGLDTYLHLATKHNHVDSMVASGIVLVEGLGVEPRELEGMSYFERAIELDDSAQALYELATLYYTGLDGVLEENPVKAFELFERAAAYEHTGAMYMAADCLVEGEGCEKSVAKAVPLFYKAAERGHRYSRQRIRELLAKIDYPF